MAQLNFIDHVPEEYEGNIPEFSMEKIKRDTEEFTHIYYVETACIKSDNYVIDKIEFKVDIASNDVIRSVYIDFIDGCVIAVNGSIASKTGDIYTIIINSSQHITSDVIQIRIQKDGNGSCDKPIKIIEGKMFFKK